jgi:medium-chain acyl-[acyl-carrier-protein] hydrolase
VTTTRITWRAPRERELLLLCLPYAGGDASAYRSWSARLSTSVRVGCAELPGRGDFFRLQSLRRLADQVEWLLPEVREISTPLAIFGYSMGALLAFELAHALRAAHARAPVLLMLAAHAPPSHGTRARILHTLPDDEFVRGVASFDGTSPEVCANAELMELLLPRLRSDVEACENYAPPPRPPLDVPFVIYGGVADAEVPHGALLHWAPLSRGRFDCVLLPGGHFFLQTSFDTLILDVNRRLHSINCR